MKKLDTSLSEFYCHPLHHVSDSGHHASLHSIHVYCQGRFMHEDYASAWGSKRSGIYVKYLESSLMRPLRNAGVTQCYASCHDFKYQYPEGCSPGYRRVPLMSIEIRPWHPPGAHIQMVFRRGIAFDGHQWRT